MSTGYGLVGRTSRCFGDFEKFSICMKTSDEPLANCGVLRDGYLECLHGKEYFGRQREIAWQKAENEKIAKEGGKAGGGHGHGH